MELFLLSPALTGLWDQWLTYVPQLAPILADKNIAAFATLAKNNSAYPQQFMRYSDPSAENLVNTVASKIWGDQLGIRIGLTQLAQQLDALENTATTVSAAAAVIAQRFPTQGPGIASVQPGL